MLIQSHTNIYIKDINNTKDNIAVVVVRIQAVPKWIFVLLISIT